MASMAVFHFEYKLIELSIRRQSKGFLVPRCCLSWKWTTSGSYLHVLTHPGKIHPTKHGPESWGVASRDSRGGKRPHQIKQNPQFTVIFLKMGREGRRRWILFTKATGHKRNGASTCLSCVHKPGGEPSARWGAGQGALKTGTHCPGGNKGISTTGSAATRVTAGGLHTE